MRHDSKLKAPPPPEQVAARDWLSGMFVIVATIVAFVGFAHLSFVWTLVVSTVVLFGLLYFLWSVGVRKQRERAGRDTRV